jgi:RHS repeat-associated protein
MSGYQTGSANELTNDGTWTYTYDNEGNLTKKSKGSSAETWTYSFDNVNHLTGIQQRSTDGGTLLMQGTYTYDPMGNRLEKDVYSQSSGTTTVTRFAYLDQNSFADLNSSNQVQTRRLYFDGVDQLFARINSSGTAAWYLTDRLGSVRDLTDNTGAVQDQITYDGFGNATETNSSFGDRYKFTGRETDSESGLQYNRDRFYDPKVGRWLSRDQLGFGAGDPNVYRYVRNDPLGAVDPTGLQQLRTEPLCLQWKSFYNGKSGPITIRKTIKDPVVHWKIDAFIGAYAQDSMFNVDVQVVMKPLLGSAQTLATSLQYRISADSNGKILWNGDNAAVDIEERPFEKFVLVIVSATHGSPTADAMLLTVATEAVGYDWAPTNLTYISHYYPPANIDIDWLPKPDVVLLKQLGNFGWHTGCVLTKR